MLVLGRNLNERVIVQFGGQLITILVTDVRDGRVRLGFTAPEGVVIDREEIYIDKQANGVIRDAVSGNELAS